ncbi:pyridoxal kinase [Dichotomocladium elegans]|nr:pyridoxal kinase [Dichotomocladium elegans]
MIILYLKRINPNLIFVCDPVMGDWGRLYVAPEIVPLYRNIMKTVDIATPNQFEAEVLTQITIDSLQTAREAALKLHSFGVSKVIITTLKLPVAEVPEEIRLPGATDESLYCLSSRDNGDEQQLISFPTYRGYFSGTGDMFSALAVARWQEQLTTKQNSLGEATKRIVSTVNAITRRTWEYQKKHVKMVTNGAIEELDGRPTDPALIYCCELQMVKGKAEIENPDLVGKDVIKMARLQ